MFPVVCEGDGDSWKLVVEGEMSVTDWLADGKDLQLMPSQQYSVETPSCLTLL